MHVAYYELGFFFFFKRCHGLCYGLCFLYPYAFKAVVVDSLTWPYIFLSRLFDLLVVYAVDRNICSVPRSKV